LAYIILVAPGGNQGRGAHVRRCWLSSLACGKKELD